MLVGAVVFAVAPGGPQVVTYGSYPPLDQVEGAYQSSVTLTLDDGFLLAWSTGQVLGATLVVVGLLVLAALGGWSYARGASRADHVR